MNVFQRLLKNNKVEGISHRPIFLQNGTRQNLKAIGTRPGTSGFSNPWLEVLVYISLRKYSLR